MSTTTKLVRQKTSHSHFLYVRKKILDPAIDERELKGFYKRSQKFQCFLRQMNFDVDLISDYEVLCYHEGKLESLCDMLFEWREDLVVRFDRNTFRRTRNILELAAIRGAADVAYKKLREIRDFKWDIFDPEYDAIERTLERQNKKFDKIKEESEEKIEQADTVISRVMDFLF